MEFCSVAGSPLPEQRVFLSVFDPLSMVCCNPSDRSRPGSSRRKSGGLVPAGQVQSGGDRGVPGRSGREPFEGLWGFADRTPGLREAGLGMSAWVRRAWNAGVRC